MDNISKMMCGGCAWMMDYTPPEKDYGMCTYPFDDEPGNYRRVKKDNNVLCFFYRDKNSNNMNWLDVLRAVRDAAIVFADDNATTLGGYKPTMMDVIDCLDAALANWTRVVTMMQEDLWRSVDEHNGK